MSEKKDDYDFKMYIASGCGHCADAKEKYKTQLESGLVETIDVTKDRAAFEKLMELAKKSGRSTDSIGVPVMVVRDKITGSEEMCELSKEGGAVYCSGDKKIEL